MINRLIAIDTKISKEGKLTFENPILNLEFTTPESFIKIYETKTRLKKLNSKKVEGIFLSSNN